MTDCDKGRKHNSEHHTCHQGYGKECKGSFSLHDFPFRNAERLRTAFDFWERFGRIYQYYTIKCGASQCLSAFCHNKTREILWRSSRGEVVFFIPMTSSEQIQKHLIEVLGTGLVDLVICGTGNAGVDEILPGYTEFFLGNAVQPFIALERRMFGKQQRIQSNGFVGSLQLIHHGGVPTGYGACAVPGSNNANIYLAFFQLHFQYSPYITAGIIYLLSILAGSGNLRCAVVFQDMDQFLKSSGLSGILGFSKYKAIIIINSPFINFFIFDCGEVNNR